MILRTNIANAYVHASAAWTLFAGVFIGGGIISAQRGEVDDTARYDTDEA